MDGKLLSYEAWEDKYANEIVDDIFRWRNLSKNYGIETNIFINEDSVDEYLEMSYFKYMGNYKSYMEDSGQHPQLFDH